MKCLIKVGILITGFSFFIKAQTKWNLRFVDNIIHKCIIAIIFGHMSIPWIYASQISRFLGVVIFYTDLNAQKS